MFNKYQEKIVLRYILIKSRLIDVLLSTSVPSPMKSAAEHRYFVINYLLLAVVVFEVVVVAAVVDAVVVLEGWIIA